MNLENYIKDLAPELQEKARTCSSVQELLQLAKDEKVPIPDEALAVIAAGDDDDPDPENCGGQPIVCPRCGSTDVGYEGISGSLLCHHCGYMW